MTPLALTVVIIAVSYLLILADRFDRSLIALLGAGAMILAGVISQDEAARGIDFNTLALLAGTMVMVAAIQRSGAFEWLAVRVARVSGGSPALMLALLAVATALVSTALNNVTTILLVAPVTLALARRQALPPLPFLIAETMASNIGGTATLIGDPPNMMIGSAAGLDFNAFLANLAPLIAVVLAVQTLLVHLVWGRRLERRPSAALESPPIADRRLLVVSLTILAVFLVVLVAGGRPAANSGTVAMVAAALLLLLDHLALHRHDRAARVTGFYAEIDWTTLFFFTGLFIMAHALETTGAIAGLARWLLAATHGSRPAAAFALLWGAALVSALFDNIPFVAVAIPLVKTAGPALGGDIAPLWWALALGACLGGNATLIGASANLAVAGVAERNGIRLGFVTYAVRAAPLTLVSLAICSAWLWWRFF